MNKIKAFFKLIRWPNLLMIILVQLLLQYLLIGHVFHLIQMESPLEIFHFYLLMTSTVFMAAFGYAYNDVKDIDVDEINKNSKRIIGVHFSKKAGFIIAFTMLSLSMLPAIFLSISLNMLQLIFIHLIIALGLWYYSIQLKQKALSGNILISFLTAFSIFIIWLYHLVVLTNNPSLMVEARKIVPILNLLVISYTVFAFIISLIRELIKDMEDIKGDKKANMKTFAVSFGIPKTKILIHSLTILMLLLVIFAAYRSYTYQWMQLAIYLIVAVGIPLVYLIINLRRSKTAEDFGDLSTLAKIIMVAGILSIQLFYLSYGS